MEQGSDEQDKEDQEELDDREEKAKELPEEKEIEVDVPIPPSFLGDSAVELKLRTFYFDRENSDHSENEAWAAGGSLHVRSGRWKDFLVLGAELFTSQKLDGPRDKDGTGLLKPGQHSFTVLGRAYTRLHYSLGDAKGRAVLGRQYLNLPYINRRDSRMVPNTFEAYTANLTFSKGLIMGGYIRKIKTRNSDTFVDMSNSAGVDEKDKGVSVFGILYEPTDQFSIGFTEQYGDDLFNTFYAESKIDFGLSDNLDLRLTGQVTDQRSVGSKLVTGESYDVQSWGVKGEASYLNGILSVSYTTTTKGEEIQNPYGSSPVFTSLMEENFQRAGEDAWNVGLSYHLDRFGLPGLSGFTKYSEGRHAIDATTHDSLPDIKEFNMTIDYRPGGGLFKGFWLRVRGSHADYEGISRTTKSLRLILNYDFKLH
jgi:hypothetical protein